MNNGVVTSLGYLPIDTYYDSVFDCMIDVCDTVRFHSYYEDGCLVDFHEESLQEAVEFICDDSLDFVEEQIVSDRLKAVGYTDAFMRPVNFLDDSDDGLPF